MTVVTMIDSTHLIDPAPNGVVVCAFYLHGNGASRGWPKAEVDRARQLYPALLPIKVAFLDFSDPEGEADDAVAQCAALGIDHGAIALDIEQRVAAKAKAANFPRRFTNRLHSVHGGRYSLGYTSRASVDAVAGSDGVWAAGYDNRGDLEDHEAHQYADTGGGGQWDWSVIDTDRVPLFGLVHPGPPTPTPTPVDGPSVPIQESNMQTQWVQIPIGADGALSGVGWRRVPGHALAVTAQGSDPDRDGRVYPPAQLAMQYDDGASGPETVISATAPGWAGQNLPVLVVTA